MDIRMNLPPEGMQPPKRGPKLCSQSVLYSEVPLQLVQLHNYAIWSIDFQVSIKFQFSIPMRVSRQQNVSSARSARFVLSRAQSLKSVFSLISIGASVSIFRCDFFSAHLRPGVQISIPKFTLCLYCCIICNIQFMLHQNN